MPQLKITPELEARLAKAAEERGCSAPELIASMLDASDASEAWRSHPFVTYTQSAEFRVKPTDAERYLAVLGWVATAHGPEFGDFVAHHAGGRRYVGMTAEEILETCRHNQARQIPGTRFWAIMNLDTPTKRRFLRRLLVFVGEPDEVVGHAVSLIGGRGAAVAAD